MRRRVGWLLALAPALGAQRGHDAAAYVPVIPGTTWVYALEQDGVAPGVTITKQILRVRSPGDQTLVELAVEASDPAIALPRRELLVLRRDGVRRRAMRVTVLGHSSAPESADELLLACPVGLVPGWITPLDHGRAPCSARAELVEIGRPIELPAGRFTAAVVDFHLDANGNHLRLEFAHGVGLVREQLRQGPRTLRKVELIAFEPGAVERKDPRFLVRELSGQFPDRQLDHPVIARAFESRFYRVGGRKPRLVRVWRGRATWFDCNSSPLVEHLLREEALLGSPPEPVRSQVWRLDGVESILSALAVLAVARGSDVAPADRLAAEGDGFERYRLGSGGSPWFSVQARFDLSGRSCTVRLDGDARELHAAIADVGAR